MALNSKHPQYAQHQDDWRDCRDAYQGERVVKSRGQVHLPATSGMIADGMDNANQLGYKAYQAYLTRAVFPDFVSLAVEHFIGMMHSRPPAIELPAQLEGMRESADANGNPIEHLLRRINEQQLVTGRVGLMLDLPRVPDPAQPLPYIAMYRAETMINWDDGSKQELDKPVLNLVVLDESEFTRKADFEWEHKEQYRVLLLGDPTANEASGAYRQGLFREDDTLTFNEANLIEPSIRGRKLDRIPFEFINTKDTVSSPDSPPLLGLARVCYAIYRGEADYRQNLFMQGQDTLVRIGFVDDDTDQRTGAGAIIDVPIGGDAKYIGVSANGLAEQGKALENDRAEAAQVAGRLATAKSKSIESGDALQTRVAAAVASLTTIALSSAMGLERLLKTAAVWVGANPDEVSVTPNLEFADSAFDTKSLVELMTAKNLGAPIARKSVHALMQDRGLTQMEYDDEVSEIESEEPLSGSSQANAEAALALEEQGLGQQQQDNPEDDPNAPPGGSRTPPAGGSGR
jgi:hypothetical protein